MNIWYISKYAVSPDLGQPTRQFFMSKYLARLGCELTLISSMSSGIKVKPVFKGNYYQNIVENVKTITLNGPLVNYGISLKRMFSWIVFEFMLFRFTRNFKESRPDVIIVSSLSLLTFISGVYLKRKYKAKLVLEVRDIWPLTLIEVGGFSKNNPFIKMLSSIEKYGYRNADGIVGTMPKLNEHLLNIISKPFNFQCIPMGYDPDYFSKDIDRTELELISVLGSLPQNKFIVGYAGTIGVANLVNEILEAAKLLQSSNPTIYFAILGEGNLKEELMKKYEGLENVKFYPKIEKKYVPAFLERCNLLVNCWKNEGIYRYGVSPNKWIDYMLSGRPILVSFGGYKSMINEAECGYFIEPNDPRILANRIVEMSNIASVDLVKMGQKGKDYVVKNHNYMKLAYDYKQFIDSLK